MKKVLSGLILTSLFAFLLVPTISFAATCGNCVQPPASPGSCSCGANELNKEGGLYCYTGTVYGSLSACQAVAGGGGGGGGSEVIPEPKFTDLNGLVALMTTIGNWIFTGLMALAVIFLVVAGYYFITAGDKAENVVKARQMVINALLGVAVGLAAKGLIAVVKSLVLN